MQGPLPTPPWPAIVYAAAVFIKYTVTIHDFHLDDVAPYSPVRFSYLFRLHLEGLYHPLLITFIKRDGGFSMTTMSTPSAGKNPGRYIHTDNLYTYKKTWQWQRCQCSVARRLFIHRRRLTFTINYNLGDKGL